ncbi:MAG: hypothetical protein N2043_01615 [Ignavibacterium sp.]|nr:hypothetical protein [Ignavibacterium sp.]
MKVLEVVNSFETEVLTQFKKVFGEHFQNSFDYSVQSLAIIQEIIQGTKKATQKKNHHLLFSFGLYLGQTIIKNFPNARWIDEEIDNPYEIKICIEINKNTGEEIQLFPIKRVYKFYEDYEYDFISYYKGLQEIISKHSVSFLNDYPTEEWIDVGGNVSLRIFETKD